MPAPPAKTAARPGSTLHRLLLRFLCRHAVDWRGIWRLDLYRRAIEFRFARPGTLLADTKWGVPMEVRRNDAVSHIVYFFGDYEKKLLAAIKDELQDGDLALDVGANIGVVSLYCATRVGRRGRVFAIEALPQNFQMLQGNIGRAGFTDVVLAEPCAVGAEEKDITIRFDEDTANWGATSLLDQSGASSHTIPMVRLDTLWEKWGKPRLQLVKMDVEGFEAEVLKGAVKLLRESPPKVWIVEFNFDHAAPADNGPAAVWNCFLSHAYVPFDMKSQARLTQMPTRHCDVLFRWKP